MTISDETEPIPVYDTHPDTIVVILYAKDLLGIVLSEKDIKVSDIQEKKLPLKVNEIIQLDDLLNHLIKMKRHIAIVYDEYGSFTGVVTLEDVLEEILRIEILEEKDAVVDMQLLAKEIASKNDLN